MPLRACTRSASRRSAAELVPAGTDERSGHEEQQREQELTLQQLHHADDDEDDGE